MATESLSRQRGVAAVEAALALPIFLLLVLGGLEMCRMLYLWNTLQVASHRAARAAALADFTDAAALQHLRWRALLRSSAGPLPLAPDIVPERVVVDYLSLDASGAMQPLAALPACPAANRLACARDPHGSDCIRFVRVRLCGPGGSGDCPPLPYTPLLPLVPVPAHLPPSSAVVRAETLGYQPGADVCL